jgi:hypothetical protein
MPSVGARDRAAGRFRLVSWLFARTGVQGAVTTRLRLNASPVTVWDHIMFYEDVPGRPSLLLRALLPYPVRTHGDKTRVGTTVRCEYKRGNLVKRITTVDSPYRLRFDVIEQQLGIEDCVRTVGGSYQISPCGDASEVVLTTMYHSFLRPRSFWRPFESLVLTRLHGHILQGLESAVDPRGVANRAAVT